eukprot:5697881-Amphidinium_carterae.3
MHSAAAPIVPQVAIFMQASRIAVAAKYKHVIVFRWLFPLEARLLNYLNSGKQALGSGVLVDIDTKFKANYEWPLMPIIKVRMSIQFVLCLRCRETLSPQSLHPG